MKNDILLKYRMQKKLIERYLRILFDIKMSQNVGVKKMASG